MNQTNFFYRLKLLLVLVLLVIIPLQASTLYSKVAATEVTSLMKRQYSWPPYSSQENKRFQTYTSSFQDNEILDSFNSLLFDQQEDRKWPINQRAGELINTFWVRLLEEAKQKEPAFKNPVDISNFDDRKKKQFALHITRSDIVRIGATGNYRIFADLTNGIAKITPNHLFYKVYAKVYQDRYDLSQKSLKAIRRRLRSSFVTIHPRTYSIFNEAKMPIFQEADSHNAIEYFHPHYPVYEKRFAQNMVEWKELWGKVKNLALTDSSQVSPFDKRPLIDFRVENKEGFWRTPDDFEYPVLYRAVLEWKKEQKMIDELISKNRKVLPSPLSTDEDPAFELQGFYINPVKSHHRSFGKIKGIYEDQEKNRLFKLGDDKIIQMGRVKPCSDDDLLVLCVEGLSLLEPIVPRHPNFLKYWNAYIKGQIAKREQEKREEIILHNIEVYGKDKFGNPIFHDTYLGGKLIIFKHPYYKDYFNAWNLQQYEIALRKQKCQTNLVYCDFTLKFYHNIPYFSDSTKGKIIYKNDKEFKNYLIAWNSLEDERKDAADPVVALSNEYGVPLELIPVKGRLPRIQNYLRIAEPFTLRWKVYRDGYLKQRMKARRDEEEYERKNEALIPRARGRN